MNERAYEQALTYLAKRNYSARELAQKLQHKGYETSETDEVLARLSRSGLVDDEALAQRLYAQYVEDGVYGNSYIAYRLQQKGLAMPARMSADEENERALRLVRRRLLGASATIEKRKLASFLANRGYGAGTLYAVCEALGESVLLDTPRKKFYNK